ncbi:MAG: uridine kinase [Bacteroidetes bacterium]|nr:MAG: uridine kinase [Bacteroidota bacterium]
MNKKPYMIGICGGSASGKTFLLSQIMGQLPADQVTLISQDNYYLPLEEQVRNEDGLVNFDHPDSVDLDLLISDVHRILDGETVFREEYVFNNPNVTPRTLELKPSRLVVLEGLFIYHKSELARLMDLKVFVEADEHIRLARRLRRDHSERGYTIEEILRDYEKFVAPMYSRYVAPTRQLCDIIIPNNSHLYRPVQVLVNHLKFTLGSK